MSLWVFMCGYACVCIWRPGLSVTLFPWLFSTSFLLWWSNYVALAPLELSETCLCLMSWYDYRHEPAHMAPPYFLRKTLTEPRAHRLSWTSRDPSLHLPNTGRVSVCHHSDGFFNVGFRDQTQVQTLYLIHLPRGPPPLSNFEFLQI